MSYPADLKYTKDHEWIRLDGDTGAIGITDFAQQQLGDVVYVELPDVGTTADGRAGVRHHRIGEGGLGAVRAGDRRSGRGEQRPQGQARERQRQAARDLDGQGEAVERRRGGGAPGRGGRTRHCWPSEYDLRAARHLCATPHRPARRGSRRDAEGGRRRLARRADRRGDPGQHPPGRGRSTCRRRRANPRYLARLDDHRAQEPRRSAATSASAITTRSRRASSSAACSRTRAGTRPTRRTRPRSPRAASNRCSISRRWSPT